MHVLHSEALCFFFVCFLFGVFFFVHFLFSPCACVALTCDLWCFGLSFTQNRVLAEVLWLTRQLWDPPLLSKLPFCFLKKQNKAFPSSHSSSKCITRGPKLKDLLPLIQWRLCLSFLCRKLSSRDPLKVHLLIFYIPQSQIRNLLLNFLKGQSIHKWTSDVISPLLTDQKLIYRKPKVFTPNSKSFSIISTITCHC